jgi:hypothetical protein
MFREPNFKFNKSFVEHFLFIKVLILLICVVTWMHILRYVCILPFLICEFPKSVLPCFNVNVYVHTSHIHCVYRMYSLTCTTLLIGVYTYILQRCCQDQRQSWSIGFASACFILPLVTTCFDLCSHLFSMRVIFSRTRLDMHAVSQKSDKIEKTKRKRKTNLQKSPDSHSTHFARCSTCTL